MNEVQVKTIVFSGPSISRDAVEAVQGVEWQAPVSQGDVYRAAQTAPDVIAIIDGYFEGVPSVWHKEILWAMSRGIHVFGASSMGALRAAELHSFGMRGVGEIFACYRDGVLEDDDEVAVLHGPAELGYLSLSLPMVNVRATVSRALTESVVSKQDADLLIAAAKSIFYQKRQWLCVVAAAKQAGAEAHMLSAFERWLPGGEQDLKCQDAEALLAALAAFSSSEAAPMRCDYAFEWTVAWDSVVTGHALAGKAEKSHVESKQLVAGIEQLIIDELRLAPLHYRQVMLRARLKKLALHEAGRKRIAIGDRQMCQQLQAWRENLGLYTRVQLDQWIEQNNWTLENLQQALQDEQLCKAVENDLDDESVHLLLNELRLSGEYNALKACAEAKRAACISGELASDIVPAQLLAWYFESKLGKGIPANLDDYLLQIGLHRREDFYQLVKKQHFFELAMKRESQ